MSEHASMLREVMQEGGLAHETDAGVRSFSRLAKADVIGVFQSEGGVLKEASDACLFLLGRTRGELVAGALTHDALFGHAIVRRSQGGLPRGVPGGVEADGAAVSGLVEAAPSSDARFEIECTRSDGRVVSLAVVLSPRGRDGCTGVVFELEVPRDDALGRIEARFRAAAEGFDAFVILDAVRDERGRIVDFRYAELNSVALERTGRTSRDEVLGRTVMELFPSAQLEATLLKYAEVVETQRATEEEAYVNIAGLPPRWVARHVVPLGDGVAVTSRDITQRRSDDEERKELLTFLDSIFDNMPATIFVKDAATLRFQRFNRFGERLFGIPPGGALKKTNHELFPKEKADFFEESDREVVSTGNTFTIEQKLHTSIGERWFKSTKIALPDLRGMPRHLLGISVDITEIKQAEESLRGFEVLFRHSPLGILISSAEGIIVDANEAATRLLGFDAHEMMGKSSSAIGFMQAEDRERTFQAIKATGNARDLVLKIKVKSGAMRDVMVSVERLEVARETRYITTFLDITALKQAEESLREASLVDELTGLHNRRGFFALGHQHVKMAKRLGGPQFALLFIDLDGLKKINDSLGHGAGDAMIRDAATFLRGLFRESDILARLGGDEFVVLAACNAIHAQDLVMRVRDGLRDYNERRNGQRPLAMSVGASTFRAGSSLEEVLAEADRQMYLAKAQRSADP